MRLLSSLIASFYWSTAHERGGAKNGYSLTGGNFRREAQVEFATGKLKLIMVGIGTKHQCLSRNSALGILPGCYLDRATTV